MKFSEYVRDKWFAISTGFLTCFLAAQFLWIMGTDKLVIAVVAVLYFLGLFCTACYDCFRKKQYYDHLESTWQELEEKSYLSEIIEEPDFYDGRLLYRIIKRNGKYLNDVIADQQLEMMEYKNYVQTWAHEIKTPIAVEHLIIDNHRGPLTSSLEEEVEKIESYVEQMLYYTKSGSLESDYIIQPVSLKHMVMEVIRKNTKMMVAAGILPRLENLDHEILTDTKWMVFILGQIVTNAVKYSDSSKNPAFFSEPKRQRGIWWNLPWKTTESASRHVICPVYFKKDSPEKMEGWSKSPPEWGCISVKNSVTRWTFLWRSGQSRGKGQN